MTRQLTIVLFALTLLGCKDLGVEPEPTPTNPPIDTYSTLVPGIVGVFFADGTTIEQAQQLVDSLGLSFKFTPSGTPLTGVISVPEGSEDEWAVMLRTYPLVKVAERIAVTWTS